MEHENDGFVLLYRVFDCADQFLDRRMIHHRDTGKHEGILRRYKAVGIDPLVDRLAVQYAVCFSEGSFHQGESGESVPQSYIMDIVRVVLLFLGEHLVKSKL